MSFPSLLQTPVTHPPVIQESSDGVYCSPECYNEDNPSTSHSSILDFYDVSAISQAGPSSNLWPASNHEGILAWARNVSPGLPRNERTPSPRRPASKPVLLSTGMSSRPLAPALSVASSPVLAQPSHPIQTPRSSERLRPSLYHQSAGGFSTTTTSLATDSVATPVSGEDERVLSPNSLARPSQSSVIGAIAKHVRTWVGNTSSRQTPHLVKHLPRNELHKILRLRVWTLSHSFSHARAEPFPFT